jgi:lysine 2,3-aminomutase
MNDQEHVNSMKRAKELKSKINDYLNARDNIQTGFERIEENSQTKSKIITTLKATDKDWSNWKWQIKNRFSNVEQLQKILNTCPQLEDIKKVEQVYRWAVSPYYLSLSAVDNVNCPIRKQFIPSILELQDELGLSDPVDEKNTSPTKAVVRRYPDRLIIKVTNQCASFCRHCQRKRTIGKQDLHTSSGNIEKAIDYIKKNPEIRDVLITGGDALLLSDKKLDWLLTELDNINHVEIKRIGTRVPVTLPMRITEKLCGILGNHPPLYINTQFNHPLEVTPEAATACNKLIQAGVVLGNQSVLLKEINDNPHIIKKLNQELLKIRVKPYYLFHAMPVKGTRHFSTKLSVGLEIMEKLRGYTSGLVIPSYIVNVNGGLGKVPIQPQYLFFNEHNEITLRTWENKLVAFIEKS